MENIESPTLLMHPPQSYQQAFHQQVPLQVTNGLAHESHNRNPSYPAQMSTGTPLSGIPERAIHAAPFQPAGYTQQGYYGAPYPMMPAQQGFFYPPSRTAAAYPHRAQRRTSCQGLNKLPQQDMGSQHLETLLARRQALRRRAAKILSPRK